MQTVFNIYKDNIEEKDTTPSNKEVLETLKAKINSLTAELKFLHQSNYEFRRKQVESFKKNGTKAKLPKCQVRTYLISNDQITN